MNPLYRHTVGSGPDVVLLHGWGMHSGVWEDVVEALLDHHVGIGSYPGRIGRGGAGCRTALRGLGRLVAGRAGSSKGNDHRPGSGEPVGTGQQHAQYYPTTRLAARHRPAGAAPFRRGIAPGLSRRAQTKRFIALEVYGSEHASAQLRQLKAMLFQHGEPDVTALEDGLEILETADLRADLPRIACPTLLLMGQRDQLAPAAAGEAMWNLLPDARLHIFLRAGHAPFFSHLPAFMAELRAFLDA